MRSTPYILVSLLVLGCLTACSDDESSKPVLWKCICRGAYADGGMPFPQAETIEHCSAADPTEMLSQRYRAAAEADDPAYTGSCQPCDPTDESCTPEE